MSSRIHLLVFGLVLVSSVFVADAKFYSETIARDRLIRDLFTNYDSSARPALHGEKVDLITNLELQHFEFREADGAFKFHGKLYVSWNDTKLRWSLKDYNNITRIHVPSKTLWVPDLEIYNNAPDQFLRMHYRGIVMVESSGLAMWADNIEMTVFCSTDMRRWPFDRHECKLTLGSWTHHGNEVDILGADQNLSMSFDDFVMKNTEYRVVNYTAVHVATIYSCCEEPYISMNYQLIIERRAGFAVIFQTPALCVVLLTMAVFCLEPQRGEKLLLHGISLFIIVFNLIYFAGNIGKFARNVPLIVIFYSVSFVLVTFATLLSVFSLSVSRSKLRKCLPPGLAKVLKSRLGSMLDPYSSHVLQPENSELHSQFEDVKSQEYSNLIVSEACPDEWMRFAVVVERTAFLVYGVTFVVLGTSCFL